MPLLAIRADGNGHIGMGHIFRALHLARGLRAKGVDSRFLILESTAKAIADFLSRDGFGFDVVSSPSDAWRQDEAVLLKSLNVRAYDAVLVDLLIPDGDDDDLLQNPEFVPADVPATLNALRHTSLPLAAISDQYDRMNLDADLVINTCPVQDPAWYVGTPLAGRCLLGAAAYLLPDSFRAQSARTRLFGANPAKVVAFFGGNDHRGFTTPVVAALEPLRKSNRISLELIVGAATHNAQGVIAALNDQGITTHYRLPDIASVFEGAEILLTASGNTLFDAAALGLPAVALSTRKRQKVTASYFHDHGSAIDLGVLDEQAWRRLANDVSSLLDNPSRLQSMSRAGQSLVDGKGIERVTAALEMLYE